MYEQFLIGLDIGVIGSFCFKGDALAHMALSICKGKLFGDVFIEMIWISEVLLFLNWKESCPGKRMISLTFSISTTHFSR